MLERRLTLEHFRAFIAVVECGSFSVAAQQTGRTQSALTHQIKAMEEILGKRLLLRSRGHCGGLTAEGSELLPHARHVLNSVRSAFRSVAPASVGGKLRIGIMDDFDMRWLMDLIVRFTSRYPEGEVSVVSDLSARLEERLRHKEIDLALLKRLSSATAPDVIKLPMLRREKLCWIHAPGFSWSADKILPLLVFHEGCVYRQQLPTLLKQANIRFRIAYATYSYANIRAAAAAGLGVAMLPATQTGAPPVLYDSKDSGLALPDAGWVELVAKTAEARPNPIVAAFLHALQSAPRLHSTDVAGR